MCILFQQWVNCTYIHIHIYFCALLECILIHFPHYFKAYASSASLAEGRPAYCIIAITKRRSCHQFKAGEGLTANRPEGPEVLIVALWFSHFLIQHFYLLPDTPACQATWNSPGVRQPIRACLPFPNAAETQTVRLLNLFVFFLFVWFFLWLDYYSFISLYSFFHT